MTELLTVDNVAQITGLSAYTVRAAIRDGELRASKMRGRYRIHPDQLAAWIDDTTVRGAGARVDDRAHRPASRPPRATPPSTSAREAIRQIQRNAA